MKRILVEPEQLEACASRMDQQNQNYQKSYAQLFNAVDTMQSAWTGRDNIAFSSRIRKFESDFRQMSVLCAQYSEFLRTSARAYRQTQDELTSQASRLG